jgi:hypothetical protein
MADFPSVMIENPPGACITNASVQAGTYGSAVCNVVNAAAAAWPAANLGLFIPFTLDAAATAKQMFWENGAVAGTTDIGIYDANGNRLVSLGATTNAGTLQIGNITDTALTPGLYYMAMVASTVTTQTYISEVSTVAWCRACGMQQQAIGSATLPNPATFAAAANAYIPLVGVSFQAVM